MGDLLTYFGLAPDSRTIRQRRHPLRLRAFLRRWKNRERPHSAPPLNMRLVAIHMAAAARKGGLT